MSKLKETNLQGHRTSVSSVVSLEGGFNHQSAAVGLGLFRTNILTKLPSQEADVWHQTRHW